MSGSSSVPRAAFTPTGFSSPSEEDILAGALADLTSAFGGRLNPSLATPQGQLATSLTAIIGDKDSQFLAVANGVDPAFASGRLQDAIGRIYFIERKPALPTVVQANCVGLPGTLIAAGALALATDGSLYACQTGGVIPASGTIQLAFANTQTGPIACPATSLSVIYRQVSGWDTISNPSDGVPGQNVESREMFEERRRQSVAGNAVGSLGSVLGAVLSVADVLDVYVTENVGDDPISAGGVTLVPHSLYVCASGGDQNVIAEAIWRKKGTGCNYNGNTNVIITDQSYAPPQPTYLVSFQIAIPTPVLFQVICANSGGVPSNAQSLISAAIVNAFTGGDGGPRARIGSTIYASRFYSAVTSLGAWAQVIAINVGIDVPNSPTVTMQINQVPVVASTDIGIAFV